MKSLNNRRQLNDNDFLLFSSFKKLLETTSLLCVFAAKYL